MGFFAKRSPQTERPQPRNVPPYEVVVPNPQPRYSGGGLGGGLGGGGGFNPFGWMSGNDPASQLLALRQRYEPKRLQQQEELAQLLIARQEQEARQQEEAFGLTQEQARAQLAAQKSAYAQQQQQARLMDMLRSWARRAQMPVGNVAPGDIRNSQQNQMLLKLLASLTGTDLPPYPSGGAHPPGYVSPIEAGGWPNKER